MSRFGKLFFTLVILAIAAFGISRFMGKSQRPVPVGPGNHGESADPAPASAAAFEFQPAGPAPKLPPAQPFIPQDDTVVINLSEYAGYAGLILANGGLEPSASSWFTENGGFKVKITLSDEDSWDQLQTGRIAATATTADVLSNYGRQWATTVPAQIAWSRGADGIIVRNEIKRVNDLKGKTIATAAFSEAEFFIRYLAQEAGISVKRLDEPGAGRDPESINLVFLEDAFAAGDAFLEDLKSGGKTLDGCVTWAPKTTEVVNASGGAARQLVDNRNLLIIADILLFNKAFAKERPEVVKAIVEGMLLFNDRIRANPESYLDGIAAAFKTYGWTKEDARAELAKVHLSNLPENLDFFGGAIDAAGSFASVYQSANLAYGAALQPNPVSASFFADTAALEAIKAKGSLAAQTAAIRPIQTSNQTPIEQDPLLTRDIRFYFLPNESKLDMANSENGEFLSSVNRLLGVSPGSMILLRGHVDDANIVNFRQQGGEALVRKMALTAMELSNKRAEEVKNQLLRRYPQVDPKRLEVVGRGWEEPAGKNPDMNRRVEVQWFTLE